MDYAAMKGLSLKVFLGFLGLTAIVAIISVLSGEFGELQGKILVTCSAVSAASICSMSCAAFIEKTKLVQVGLAGICFAIVAAILLILGIWVEIKGDAYWKTMFTFAVGAISLAYAFLLSLARLDDRQRWIQWMFCISVGVLALQIIIGLWAELHSEGYTRALAVVAILIGLQTLAIPILSKMRRDNGGQPEQLVLERVSGNIFRDATGKKYRLQEIQLGQRDEDSE